MSVAQRTRHVSRPARSAGGLLCVATAIGLAGCSANITRLDAPSSFTLNDGPRARQNVGGPVPAQPFNDAAPSNIYASTPRNGGPTEMANLPPLTDSQAPRALAVSRPGASGQIPALTAIAPAAQSAPARGQQIEVQQGDTLYGIGKRHNVLISDLMAVNELKNPNLKPGQKLYLPAGNRSAASVVKPQRPPTVTVTAPVAATPAPAPSAPAPAPALAASGADTYTVKPGDSLYAVAARHKVKLQDLQRANDITDARKVKPGTVLKIPGVGGSTAAAPVATEGSAAPEPRIVRTGPAPIVAPPAAGAAAGLKVLNGEAPRQVAAVEPATRTDAPAAAVTPAPAPAAATNGKLRWPVKGRVVQGFGPRSDGTHNDGVDIAVPAGTDVLSAETGVVAYAGNEVKAYGNLVLIRHDNGWVTAYAYNEKILVSRGDRVKRGQPIAKAGKSGGADQPQLHFEVRVGSKPVDPTGYLERM